MAGIIKGDLRDAEGVVINPGKPVTLKAVRSDGLPEVAITTEDDGTWSFEINADVASTVDFTFMYNGVDVGEHAVRFIDNADLFVVPYSTKKVKSGLSPLVGVALKDPATGKGIPNFPITFHMGSVDSAVIETVRTDVFGIAEYRVNPATITETTAFFMKANDDVVSHSVELVPDGIPFAYELGNFDYIRNLDSTKEFVAVYQPQTIDGEISSVSLADMFNKTTLESVTFDLSVAGNQHLYLKAEGTFDIGENIIVVSDEGGFEIATVEVGTFSAAKITSVKPVLEGSTHFPAGVYSTTQHELWTYVTSSIKFRPVGYTELPYEADGMLDSAKVFPDGRIVLPLKGSVNTSKTYVIKNPDSSKAGEYTANFITPTRFGPCGYSTIQIPRGNNGVMAVYVTDTNDEGQPGAVVEFTVLHPYSHKVMVVTDEFGIAELPVMREVECTVDAEIRFGLRQVDDRIIVSNNPTPMIFASLVFPTSGDSLTANRITGQTLDQTGQPIRAGSIAVFNKTTLENLQVDPSNINADGTFAFDFGPLEIGTYTTVLATYGGYEMRDQVWVQGIPEFDTLLAVNTNPTLVYEGDKSTFVFACVQGTGDAIRGIPGVPVIFKIDSGPQGEHEIHGVTDPKGYVEIEVPAGFNGVNLSGRKNFEVRVEGVASINGDCYWGINTTSRVLIDPLYMQGAHLGEAAPLFFGFVDQDGNKAPYKELKIWNYTLFKPIPTPSHIDQVNGNFQMLLPPMPEGDQWFMFGTDNYFERKATTWNDHGRFNPVEARVDTTVPDSLTLNQSTWLWGTTWGEHSLFSPNGICELTIEGPDGNNDVIINADATWCLLVSHDTEGDKTYVIKRKDDGVELARHTFKVYGQMRLDDLGYSTDKSPRDKEVFVTFGVTDADGSPIVGAEVSFFGGPQLDLFEKTVTSDEFGIAVCSLTYNADIEDGIALNQTTVTAKLAGTAVQNSHVVRWALPSENVGYELRNVVVTGPFYPDRPFTITGTVVGSLSQEKDSTMWLTVTNKDTLTTQLFTADITADGTFSADVGPYPLGINNLVVATNGDWYEDTVNVLEAPAVLSELMLVPYSSGKARPSKGGLSAFAAVGTDGVGMRDVEVVLHYDTADGEVIETKATDKYGIAEFTLPGSRGGVENSGVVKYVATVGTDYSQEHSLNWTNDQHMELIEEFEATEQVRDGVKGLISFRGAEWNSTIEHYNHTNARGGVGVFNKSTLEIVPHTWEDVSGTYKFPYDIFLELEPQINNVPHDLVLYVYNARTQVTMTWGDYAEVTPHRIVADEDFGRATRVTTETMFAGNAFDENGNPLRLTGPLKGTVGKVGNSFTRKVMFTPKGRFVSYIMDNSKGYLDYEFKYGDKVLLSIKMFFYLNASQSILPFSTPQPPAGTAATIGVLVKQEDGSPMPYGRIMWRDKNQYSTYDQYDHNVATNAEGVAIFEVPFDPEKSDMVLSLSVPGTNASSDLSLSWKTIPDQTGAMFETLTIPTEQIAGGSPATISGKVIDQNGVGFDAGILGVYNFTTRQNYSFTDAIGADGAFTAEVPFGQAGVNELKVYTKGCVDDGQVHWGPLMILDTVVVTGDNPGQGVATRPYGIFGTALTPDGVQYIPAEEGVTFTITNNVNAEEVTATFDTTGIWRATLQHDSVGEVTYTFKQGEKPLGTYVINYIADYGHPDGINVNYSFGVGNLTDSVRLFGSVLNNQGQPYSPPAEESFEAVVGSSRFPGTLHIDGTFEVYVTNSVAETVTYAFMYGEHQFGTVDVKYFESVVFEIAPYACTKAAVGGDIYTGVRLADGEGNTIEGALVEWYVGDATTPEYEEETYSGYPEGYLTAPSTEGDVVIRAVMNSFNAEYTVTCIGADPKFAAELKHPCGIMSVRVNNSPKTGKSALANGEIRDQDGNLFTGPSTLQLFNRNTHVNVDVSSDIAATGKLSVLIDPEAPGVRNDYVIYTDGYAHPMSVTWGDDNPDLHQVVLTSPAEVEVTNEPITFSGIVHNSEGVPVSPSKSLRCYCTFSDDYTVEFNIGTNGQWSFQRTFSQTGLYTVAFQGYSPQQYYGDIQVKIVPENPLAAVWIDPTSSKKALTSKPQPSVPTSIELVNDDRSLSMCKSSLTPIFGLVKDQYGNVMKGSIPKIRYADGVEHNGYYASDTDLFVVAAPYIAGRADTETVSLIIDDIAPIEFTLTWSADESRAGVYFLHPVGNVDAVVNTPYKLIMSLLDQFGGVMPNGFIRYFQDGEYKSFRASPGGVAGTTFNKTTAGDMEVVMGEPGDPVRPTVTMSFK